MGSNFLCSLNFPFILFGFISWFGLGLVVGVRVFVALVFFGVTNLSDSLLGGRIFKPVSSLMLKKFLG